MKPHVKDIARGHWPRILVQLGIDKAFLVNKHGPCPVCGGTDRFRFDNKRGDGTFYCNQCGPGDGIKLVMTLTGKTFQEVAQMVEQFLDGSPPPPKVATKYTTKPKSSVATPEQLDACDRIWKNAAPIKEGDSVAHYLASRGIGLSRRLQNLRIGYDTRRVPIMLARVQYGSRHTADTPTCQLHRTYLLSEGERDRKVMPMPHPAGAAVRLFDVKGRDVMGIAEGIETALSAATMFQVPVWSALNAGRLATFVPPPGITKVRIFADADHSRTGFEAAKELANVLFKAEIGASIELPPNEDTDWNDVLREFMNGALDAGGIGEMEGRRMYFRGPDGG